MLKSAVSFLGVLKKQKSCRQTGFFNQIKYFYLQMLLIDFSVMHLLA